MSVEVMRYAEPEELHAAIGQGGPDLTANERGLFGMVLDSISRDIDNHCRRHFYQLTDTQVFTADHSTLLVIPDLVSITTLKTDTTSDQSYDTTWAAADYMLWPRNASKRESGWPYTEIRVDTTTESDLNTFPLTQEAVQVAGVWGWPAVPKVIHDITLLEAARLLKDFEHPSGVAGFEGPAGVAFQAVYEPGLHPRSKRTLRPYIRMNLVVPK